MVILFCCILGEDNAFAIEISPDKTVYALQKAIVAENPVRFQGTDARQVMLKQAEIPDDGEAVRDFDFDGAIQLRGSYQISDYFIRDPLPKHIHIVIQSPDPPSPPLELRPDQPPKKTKRDEGIQDMLAGFTRDAPSKVVYNPTFEKCIENGDIKIFANRPLDLSKLPLGLLDPIFGSFCDSWTTISPTAEDNHAFMVLRSVMLKGYDSELARETALHDFFRDQFKIIFNSGGHASTSCGNFIRLLIEVKNEITGISSDPYFQAPMFYRHYLDKLCGIYFRKSAIPVMIVIVFGTYLQIMGVLVTSTGILSEPFTPALSFCSDPHDENHRLAVTRCLAALRESLVALDQHYGSLEFMPDLSPSETVFPYTTSFIPFGGGPNPVNFEYLARPYDDKLLFLAKTDSDVLIIKYTRRYSLAAHKLLSGEGRAPKLLGFRNIPGGWKMIVMKFIKAPYQAFTSLEFKARERFRDTIWGSVALLHKNGLVHGDLRPSNIFVSEESAAALIIDFDGAGLAGSAFYPPNHNTVDIVWPVGATDGGEITKEHDHFMFQRLFHSGRTHSH